MTSSTSVNPTAGNIISVGPELRVTGVTQPRYTFSHAEGSGGNNPLYAPIAAPSISPNLPIADAPVFVSNKSGRPRNVPNEADNRPLSPSCSVSVRLPDRNKRVSVSGRTMGLGIRNGPLLQAVPPTGGGP